MVFLLIASLIWGFSFGLIKHVLIAPGLNPNAVAFARLLLSCVAFMPFLRWRGIGGRTVAALIGLGMIQYGAMYVTYTNAYLFLSAHQVVLFTLLTPVYVALIHDLTARRFHARYLAAALLAVAGAAVTIGGEHDMRGTATGFLLMQVSNVCFAFGQVKYRLHMEAWRNDRADGVAAAAPADRHVFAWLYLGGALVALFPMALTGGRDWAHMSRGQLLTLAYLGLLPSALCFFLWNVGARRTNAGTLAAMNNAKIPLGILLALILFGEEFHLFRLLAGAALFLVSVWIAGRGASKRPAAAESS